VSQTIRIKLDPSKWNSMEEFLRTHKREIKMFMRAAMSVLHSQIHTNLSGPSHTKFPGNGNPYPGVLTGRMRNSINAKITSGSDWMKGVVGPNVKYARRQNDMRPFLKPAWKKQRKKVHQIFKDRMNKALGGKGVSVT